MPTSAQNQVIDPILSKISLGFKNSEHVGLHLFPVVPVSQTGGKIIEFGKEAFKLYSTARAPGQNTPRVRFGHEGKPYALENHALDAVVPREWQRDASQVPGIDLGTRAVNLVLSAGSLILENQQATIARDAANYDANHKLTLAGVDQWSDYANSDPVADVNAARQAIRASTGRKPNVMEISSLVFDVICEHPNILDKIKFTQPGIVTADILAVVFKVKKVVIGEAVAFDDAGVDIDIWGKDVVLAYVPENVIGLEQPSYGYTYQMEGHPLVEMPWNDKAAKSWIYGMAHERAPVQTGISSGFLIQNAIA